MLNKRLFRLCDDKIVSSIRFTKYAVKGKKGCVREYTSYLVDGNWVNAGTFDDPFSNDLSDEFDMFAIINAESKHCKFCTSSHVGYMMIIGKIWEINPLKPERSFLTMITASSDGTRYLVPESAVSGFAKLNHSDMEYVNKCFSQWR